jgi:TrmH family RNA methyltransferase
MGEAARTLRAMDLGIAITSKANAKVKALRAAFAGKASRAGELVGIEGEHLLGEAMRSGVALETVFVREGSERVLARPALEGLKAGEVLLVGADAFDSAVETGSPQGIAAVLRIPAMVEVEAARVEMALVLEAVQDPGNVGTLLRSAEAFGVSVVMLTPECANVWGPKVMRASAGSVFRVPIVRAPLREIQERLRSFDLRVFAAVAHGEGTLPVFETFLGTRVGVMIGNEGAGLTGEAEAMADALVTIPCATESLNAAVAGSTILYEAMRQRMLLEKTR